MISLLEAPTIIFLLFVFLDLPEVLFVVMRLTDKLSSSSKELLTSSTAMAYSSSSLSEQDTSSSLETFLALSASDLNFYFLTLEISESFSSTKYKPPKTLDSKELEEFNQDTIVYSGSATRTPFLPYSTPRISDSSQGRITPTLQYLVYNKDENNYNYYMMYKNQKYDLDNAM
ncbi:hypothetical protein Tco_1272309 [Tanacetum coccineum]